MNPLKCTFLGDYISALRGCIDLKFLHALEIDHIVLAHTPTGTGVTQKKLIVKIKIWLKIHRMSPYNFGASGSLIIKLFPGDVPRGSGDKMGITFGRLAP